MMGPPTVGIFEFDVLRANVVPLHPSDQLYLVDLMRQKCAGDARDGVRAFICLHMRRLEP